jgi:hypothetical protein
MKRVRKRKAFTLIEMLLVITSVSLVLGLCASVLAGLFRVERGARSAMLDATTVGRLARQFRADVRSAAAARRGELEPSRLELTGIDGSSVVYRLEGARLFRERLRQAELHGRESYSIERLGPVRFKIEGGLIAVELLRRSDVAPALARPEIRIEATLGKDYGGTSSRGGRR